MKLDKATKAQITKDMSVDERKATHAAIVERSQQLTTELRDMYNEDPPRYPSIGYIQQVMGYSISGKALFRKLTKLAKEFGFSENPPANLKLSKAKADKQTESPAADESAPSSETQSADEASSVQEPEANEPKASAEKLPEMSDTHFATLQGVTLKEVKAKKKERTQKWLQRVAKGDFKATYTDQELAEKLLAELKPAKGKKR